MQANVGCVCLAALERVRLLGKVDGVDASQSVGKFCTLCLTHENTASTVHTMPATEYCMRDRDK
jgi:hypothetical protein